MHFPLAKVEAADNMAALINNYLKELEPAAAAVAPRLSLRQLMLATGSQAYDDVARIHYQLHLVASALGQLHAAYHGAVAAASALVASRPSEQAGLRVTLGEYFAGLHSTGELIGAAHGDQLRSPSEYHSYCREQAKRLGYSLARASKPNPLAPAHAALQSILERGRELSEDFQVAQSPDQYGRLLKNLQNVISLRGIHWQ